MSKDTNRDEQRSKAPLDIDKIESLRLEAKRLKVSIVMLAETELTGAPSVPLDIDKGKSHNPRASIAVLSQTIQKLPREQLTIFEVFNDDQNTLKQMRASNIEEIGANLSSSGWRALLAIARLASSGGHYFRVDKARKTKGDAREDITLSQKDFFKAYGANKVITKRQLDYARSDRRDALQGLIELSKPIAQVYSLPATSGRKGRRDVIRTVAPLIERKELYLDVTSKEEQNIAKGDISGKGLKYIRISPSDIFYNSGFMNLPEGLYTKLEGLYGKKGMTPTLYKSIVILALHAHQNPENPTLRRKLDKYLANTGKNKLLESRQVSRAVKETDKELSKLKGAGGVTGHRYKNELTGRYIEIDIVPEAYK